ncbi:branched-chain amino acid ABC transporter substrate-binding protein [Luedemannella helvata]|uniref:Leucine-binding protein domain-containing protein n=1 Tax=Luedemannella helvata TaxID=349315 RepID=A0ABN2KT98_9ACTN
MNRRLKAVAALGAIALVAAGCASENETGGDSGGKTLIIGVDLPFQGASADTSEATYNAMQLYLDQIGGKAGNYTVKLQKYDDSTAAKGGWDDATCSKNATDHVNNADEVAVMGTYNSGCAKLQVGTLNQAPDGPLLMVSHANTNPGLTKAWEPGEPEKFFPSGTRSYARVITTDDYQGAAAAQFASKDLQVKKCFVLNDNQTYGQGVAKAFADEAAKQGIQVLANEAWDAKATNYTALMQKIKSAGADCVYLGGIYDNNGGQLVKDKVAVLGDNKGAVKLIGPDGFTGYEDFQKLPAGEGTYLTFAGLDASQLKSAGGKGSKLLADYAAKYGKEPASSYVLYGVQALQVILAAIEKSDGTRKGVNSQVFSGAGISISAADAVLGKDLKIDPATGDINVRDLSVLQMTSGAEKFVKPWPLP